MKTMKRDDLSSSFEISCKMGQKLHGHQGLRLRGVSRQGGMGLSVTLALIWTLTAPLGAAGWWITVHPGASDCTYYHKALNARLSSQSMGFLGSRSVCNRGHSPPIGSGHVGARRSLLRSRMGANADEPESTQPKNKSNRGNASVSRSLNQALGNIFPKGYNFGSVGGSSRTFPGANESFATNLRQDEVQQRPRDEDGNEAEDDEDEEDDESADQGGPEGSDYSRSVWRKLGTRRSRKSTNRLLRAKTNASAGVVVDGPFSALEVYMTQPVSDYSVLDNSMIRRVSDTTFRFQEAFCLGVDLVTSLEMKTHENFALDAHLLAAIPLKHLVNLDLTPTMEVEVELDLSSKSVTFRSTRSTLYGTVGSPGDEDGTKSESNDWPAPPPDKVEYFRVDFDANLRWVKGDISTEAPLRGPGVKFFTGDVTRRPRPTAQSPAVTPSLVPPSGTLPDPSGSEAGLKRHLGSRGTSVTLPSGPGDTDDAAKGLEDGVASAAAKEAALRAIRGTVLCETQVRVQVLLPPPYNTVLPWRLVRAVLGKVLSTTVAYMLPRFLELLANDFYRWQSRARSTSKNTSTSKAPGSFLAPNKSWLTGANNHGSRRRRSEDVKDGNRGFGLVGDTERSHNPARLQMGGVERLRSRGNGMRWRGRRGTEAGISGAHGQAGVDRKNLAAMDALYEWATEGITGTPSRLSQVAHGELSDEDLEDEDGCNHGEGNEDDSLEDETDAARGARSWGPAWFQRRQRRGGGAADDSVSDDSSPRAINWWG